jgi:hypothetical protein
MLHILAQFYVTQQLDHSAWVLVAKVNILSAPDPQPEWGLIWGAYAYLFKVHRDGWKAFMGCRGIDGDRLVRENYLGDFLATYSQTICEEAPSADELLAECKASGIEPPKLITADEISMQYYAVIEPILVGEPWQ